jgi:hypothetical protein
MFGAELLRKEISETNDEDEMNNSTKAKTYFSCSWSSKTSSVSDRKQSKNGE